MKTLYNYVNDLPKHLVIDSHVHLFNDKVIEYPYKNVDFKVVMVENSVKHLDRPLLPYFDNFIKHGIDSRDKLLCIGKDREETYDIYKKHKDYIAGFGEVKCYKHCKDIAGNIIERYDTENLISIFEMGVNKPIFVHWDLNGKHDDEFEKILKDFYPAKIVLCHCGINELDDQYEAFKKACELQTKHTNLWLSISWVALDYFNEHMNQLSFIPIPDHTIVGTDFNPVLTDKKRYELFKTIYDRFDTPVAIQNLFTMYKQNGHQR